MKEYGYITPSNFTRPLSLHQISSADPSARLLLGSSIQPHRPSPVGRPLDDATARQEVHTLERSALPSLVSPASRSTPTPPVPTAFLLLVAEGGGDGGRVGCDQPLPHSRAAASLTRIVLPPPEGRASYERGLIRAPSPPMATHPGIIRPRERWTSIGFARDAMGTYEALRKTDDPHVGIGDHPWSLGTAVFEAYRFAIGGVRSAHGHTARVRPGLWALVSGL